MFQFKKGEYRRNKEVTSPKEFWNPAYIKSGKNLLWFVVPSLCFCLLNHTFFFSEYSICSWVVFFINFLFIHLFILAMHMACGSSQVRNRTHTHIIDPSWFSDNTRSLTGYTTREFPSPFFFAFNLFVVVESQGTVDLSFSIKFWKFPMIVSLNILVLKSLIFLGI